MQETDVPFVKYTAEAIPGHGIISHCQAFTSEHVEQIQKFMDYQTLTDFIISNTDEHLVNFGVLRNADTMELIGPAPIYDSGNSMFYNEDRLIPYTRAELLARPITSFYKTEDKMLGKIHDRSIVKEELLPSPEEMKILYTKAGIPEQKAEFISKNYKLKLDMMHEFQHGKSISLYHEKEMERKIQYHKPITKQKNVFENKDISL